MGTAAWSEPAGISRPRFSGRDRLLHFLLGNLSWHKGAIDRDRDLQPDQHPGDVSALDLLRAAYGAPQPLANADPHSSHCLVAAGLVVRPKDRDFPVDYSARSSDSSGVSAQAASSARRLGRTRWTRNARAPAEEASTSASTGAVTRPACEVALATSV